MLDKDAESAKTLILVAIILEVVATALVIVASMLSFAVSSATVPPGSVGTVTVNPFLGLAITLMGIFLVIGLLWIFLDYFILYKKVSEGNIEEAESPSLILGIVQLLFGGLIPGILILIAHGKISNSINYRLRNQEANM